MNYHMPPTAPARAPSMLVTAILLVGIALMLLSFMTGCTPGQSVLPSMRSMMGRPEATTLRDHSADGGTQKLKLPDGTEVNLKQPDNPGSPATVTYSRTIETITPPPPPPPPIKAGPPQSSLAPKLATAGFAMAQPPPLFGSLWSWITGASKDNSKPDDVATPAEGAPTDAAPAIEAAQTVKQIEVPLGSTVTRDKTEITVTLSSTQEQAMLLAALISRKEAFLHAIMGLIVALFGYMKATDRDEEHRWPLIGWGLCVSGAFATYGTIMEIPHAEKSLLVGITWTLLVFFIYKTSVGQGIARAGVAAVTVANPLAGQLAGAILTPTPSPANQPPSPSTSQPS